jgi:hypothetical protein
MPVQRGATVRNAAAPRGDVVAGHEPDRQAASSGRSVASALDAARSCERSSVMVSGPLQYGRRRRG